MVKKKIKCIFTITLTAIWSLSSCISGPQKKDRQDKLNNKNISNEIKIEKKYLREGFITNEIYRIVIVFPKNVPLDKKTIRTMAENRTYASLQKFLRSNNRKVDKNVQAKLLNIINNDGDFFEKSIKKYHNRIFYLEIKRKNLKKHLHFISER